MTVHAAHSLGPWGSSALRTPSQAPAALQAPLSGMWASLHPHAHQPPGGSVLDAGPQNSVLMASHAHVG